METTTEREVINFTTNWNNKLSCTAFTTIRLPNKGKYQIGTLYNIHLKSKYLHTAKIIDIKPFMLAKLTEGAALIDTGYSKEECTSIIVQMYPKIDFNKTPLWHIVLKVQ